MLILIQPGPWIHFCLSCRPHASWNHQHVEAAAIMDVFRVRLNCIDHYQATPTKYDPQLRNDVRLSQIHKEPKLPVVRVFGATETGQKVCAHIHGALPYLYVEYDGSLLPQDGNRPLPWPYKTRQSLIIQRSWCLHLSIAPLYRSCVGGELPP